MTNKKPEKFYDLGHSVGKWAVILMIAGAFIIAILSMCGIITPVGKP